MAKRKPIRLGKWDSYSEKKEGALKLLPKNEANKYARQNLAESVKSFRKFARGTITAAEKKNLGPSAKPKSRLSGASGASQWNAFAGSGYSKWSGKPGNQITGKANSSATADAKASLKKSAKVVARVKKQAKAKKAGEYAARWKPVLKDAKAKLKKSAKVVAKVKADKKKSSKSESAGAGYYWYYY